MFKTGLANSTKGSSSPSFTSGEYQGQITDLKSQIVAARVTDIVLDENHPKWDIVGEWNGIGAIFYEFVNQSATGTATNYALPYDAQSKTYPLVNEIVLLFSLPDSSMGRSTNSKSYFYLKPLGIWNHPHHDAYPNPTTYGQNQLEQQDYKATEFGAVRQVTDGSTDINLNSPINPSQNTFVEKVDIHPLMPFMGDSLLEGRYGQSLRFGSTAKSKSTINNNYSNSGNNGDPITILRNGQPKKVSPKGWIPITENIRKDLSSIYLTSYQQLKTFKVASELYQSYTTPPIVPSLFTQPQIAINSNRVVINASSDSILLSAEKSIGLSTGGGVNIDATSNYISSNDIRLGSKDAKQSILLGDDTIEILKSLTGAIKDLATILQVERNWPEGVLATSYNSLAGNVLTQINSANGILSRLNDDSLKSKSTKII